MPQPRPNLGVGLASPILAAAMRLARSTAADGAFTRACLSVMPPSAQLSQTAMNVLGVPSAAKLAKSGDVRGLRLVVRLGRFDPERNPDVFWTAVAYNQLNVMEWWAVAHSWPVAGQFMLKVDGDHPVSMAVARRSFAAVEWLIGHPEVVRRASTNSTLVAAIRDTCVVRMLEFGMKELALQWIRCKYRIAKGGRRGSEHAMETGHSWQSPLIEFVCTYNGMMDVLDALEAGGTRYTALLEGDSTRILLHAIQCARLDLLDWWLNSSLPNRRSPAANGTSVDFVDRLCESQQPIKVLEWYRANVGVHGLSRLPLKYSGAGAQRNILVLDWLLHSGLEVVYTADTLSRASFRDSAVGSLEWQQLPRLPRKGANNAAGQALFTQDILEWNMQSVTIAMDPMREKRAFKLARWKKQHYEHGVGIKNMGMPIVDRASAGNCWDEQAIECFLLLNWWREFGMEIKAVPVLHQVLASQATGNIVEWWMRYAPGELREKLAGKAWSWAFKYVWLTLLDQLEKHNAPMPNDPAIVDECLDLAALEWWSSRLAKLPFAYTERALTNASECGRGDLLDWWARSGLHLKYTEAAVDLACASGHVAVLAGWLHSGRDLKYTVAAVDEASANGHSLVLWWWFRHGPMDLEYSQAAVDKASANGHVEVLSLWQASGLELKYTEAAIDKASSNGQINVLKWWASSGLPLKYSPKALAPLTSTNKQLRTLQFERVVQWWSGESGLEFPFDIMEMA